MNWIGGARARAKFKEQYNVRGNRPQTNRQDPPRVTSDGNDEDNKETQSPDVENVTDGEDLDPNYGVSGRKRTSVKRTVEGWKKPFSKSVDYSALGYRLSTAQTIQRRAVPLLEFVEKQLPNGHILSLHLSHVVDITKVNFTDNLRKSTPPFIPSTTNSSSTDNR